MKKGLEKNAGAIAVGTKIRFYKNPNKFPLQPVREFAIRYPWDIGPIALEKRDKGIIIIIIPLIPIAIAT
ncbi:MULTISPECIES: hypothetical protein [Spirulina sp. CCY15215]|uniref:hypothetical protein n=1 Tax=Spirulina sp. CCY15215 TaxID=2767591 RepID=UPI001950236F|nr:hypothetical protein [Spirulina major]